MQKNIVVTVVVTVVYLALAWLSEQLSYAPDDAWTVWLASGAVLGLLLALPRERWPAVLAGGFLGAALFALHLENVRSSMRSATA